MNIFFHLNGCPHCAEASKGILEANQNLPFDERIHLVEIMSGDPRLVYLSKKYETDDPFEWEVPILVIERPIVKKMFNSIVGKTIQRIEIGGVMDGEHYETLITKFINKGRL